MSGIRSSLVFLLLMVSVISLFVLNRWQPEIRPGVKPQQAGKTEKDPGGVVTPAVTSLALTRPWWHCCQHYLRGWRFA